MVRDFSVNVWGVNGAQALIRSRRPVDAAALSDTGRPLASLLADPEEAPAGR
jgi:hypothetical protein